MRQSYSSDGSTVETMTPKAEPIQGMFVEPGAPAGTDRCAPQGDSERLLRAGEYLCALAMPPRAGNLSRELKFLQNQKRLCASGFDRPGGCIHADRGVVHWQ